MSQAAARPRSARFVLTCIGVGLLAGLLSGLFGVGGGTVIVPLLVLILGFDQRLAAGTSLAAIVPLFERFRAGFHGKSSPVHFFWGSFDLAVTRFSGHPAPPHPGGVPGLPDRVTREAYSHEVSSAGFWAGGVTPAEPIFYSYAYPEPLHFRDAEIVPDTARFDADLGEFVLPYAAVRAAADPAATLMEFLEATYSVAADLGHWDRPALERLPVAP